MTPQDKSYCEIPLSQGQVALVDASDYEWLSQWKWCAQWKPAARSFYATRGGPHPCIEGKKTQFQMAREILGLRFGDKRVADHKDHNTLDNRRSNLRIATHTENIRNQRRHRDGASGFKGVTLNIHAVDPRFKWVAHINIKGKLKYLGSRAKPEAAHKLYCRAAKKHHKEFACFD